MAPYCTAFPGPLGDKNNRDAGGPFGKSAEISTWNVHNICRRTLQLYFHDVSFSRGIAAGSTCAHLTEFTHFGTTDPTNLQANVLINLLCDVVEMEHEVLLAHVILPWPSYSLMLAVSRRHLIGPRRSTSYFLAVNQVSKNSNSTHAYFWGGAWLSTSLCQFQQQGFFNFVRTDVMSDMTE